MRNFLSLVFVFFVSFIFSFGQTYLLPVSGSKNYSVSQGFLTDDGGLDRNYSKYANGTVTLYPKDGSKKVKLDFLYYTSSGFMYIYDGISAASPLIGYYIKSPGSVLATNGMGALTIRFETNSTTERGFAAQISCINDPGGQPDLAIESMMMGGSSPVVGGSTISIHYTTRNCGAFRASPTIEGFYISKDTIFDIHDSLVGKNSNQALIEAGSFYSGIFSFNLPSYLPVGSYYILCKADYNNLVGEINESNNVGILPFSIEKSFYDISVTSSKITPNDVPQGNTSITIDATINNGGNVTLNGVKVGYFLSSDNKLDVSDQFIGEFPGSSFSMGSDVFTFNTSISPAIQPGNYFLLTCSDYKNVLAEVNEKNNNDAIAFTIRKKEHDLCFNSIVFDRSYVAPNTSISSMIYYINLGTVPDDVAIGMYLSKDSVFDASDVLVETTNASQVPNNYPKYAYMYSHIPANTLPGRYYMIGVADYTKTLTETNEINNYCIAPIEVVAPSIDLQITKGINAGPSFVPGNPLSVSFGLISSGTVFSSTNAVGIFLSADDSLDAGDVLLDNYPISINSNTGLVWTITRNLTIPAYVLPGSYHLMICADYTHILSESNENNNVSSIPVEVQTPAMDIMMDDISQPLVVLKESPVHASINIHNTGNSGTGTCNAGIYISSDKKLDAGDLFLKSYPVPALSVNQGSYIDASINIPLTITEGDYYILYYADYQNYLNETDENNNVSYVPITLIDGKNNLTHLPLENFKDTTITTCSATVCDNNYYFNYLNHTTVSNVTILPGDTSKFIRLAFSNYPTFDNYNSTMRVYNGTTKKSPCIFSALWTMPTMLYAQNSSGALTFEFYSPGYNYGFVAKISCLSSMPKPDLKISSAITLPDNTLHNGETVNTSFRLRNIGTVNSPGNDVAFYLSTDDSLDVSDVLLYSLPGSAMNINSYTDINTKIKIPEFIVPGTYYLFVKADPANTIDEESEVNNTICRKINVLQEYMDLPLVYGYLKSTDFSKETYFTLHYEVVNNGNKAIDPFKVAFFLSKDMILDAGDTLLKVDGTWALNEGTSFFSIGYAPLPSYIDTGKYFILLKVDYLNTIAEDNELNNVYAYQIKVGDMLPDYSIAKATSSDKTTIPNGYINVGAAYINTGSCNTTTPINLGYYLSADTIADTGDVLLLSGSVSFDDGNDLGYRNVSLNIPQNTALGNYYVLIVADYDNKSKEANEKNNVFNIPISITGNIYDLESYLYGINTLTLEAGLTVKSQVKIINKGNTLIDAASIGYYLSTDTIWSINDVLIKSKNVSYLHAGSNYLFTDNLVIPAGLNPGSYYFLFVADDKKAYTEQNEKNNVGFLPVTMQSPYSDLQIYNAAANLINRIPGQSLNLSYNIYCEGKKSVGPFYVGLYISSKPVYDNSAAYLSETSISSLSYYTIGSYSSTITLPGILNPGKYYIYLLADSKNSVIESKADNNIGSFCLSINSIFIHLITFFPIIDNPKTVPGGSYNTTCLVYNAGNGSTDYSDVGYYLSKDTIRDGADYYLGKCAGTTLLSLTSANRIYKISLPMDADTGNCYLLFMTDPSNNSADVDQTNNTAFLPIHVKGNNTNNENQSYAIDVFPNPASDFIYFVGGEDKPMDVWVYDMYGHMVIEKNMKGEPLNIQSLSPGMYILKVNRFVFKVIKQ